MKSTGMDPLGEGRFGGGAGVEHPVSKRSGKSIVWILDSANHPAPAPERKNQLATTKHT